jgi:hypothetical protein
MLDDRYIDKRLYCELAAIVKGAICDAMQWLAAFQAGIPLQEKPI